MGDLSRDAADRRILAFVDEAAKQELKEIVHRVNRWFNAHTTLAEPMYAEDESNIISLQYSADVIGHLLDETIKE